MIDQVYKHLVSLTFYFQGEPYLNPQFTDMVAYANKKRIYTITSTNGHYLTPQKAKDTVLSGLDKLIISVDGTSQESYSKYRIGGTLDKVIEGTRNVLQQRKALGKNNPLVSWQFVVFRTNESEIEEIKEMGRQLGVDEVKIKTAQIYDFENSTDLVPVNAKYSRYQKSASGGYQIKNELLDQCWRMWQGCVITWDGKIVPCCFDKDAHHQVGDLTRQSFREAWLSPAYNQFRRSVLSSRKEIEICSNCTEGTKVWA
jgi:radical SAM protein with 4Fe4S-binding SPASM domain